MKLYHTPSPNPQKITFALLELGLDCEIVPVDFIKGEQRSPAFRALNPFAKVPVLVDGDLVLWDSHAILAYLGDKTGKLWPTSTAGRADALRWLFFLAGHLYPPAFDLGFNRIRARLRGIPGDQDAITRGEQSLPGVVGIVEGQLRNNQWLLGNDFTLVDCAYCPILNLIEKAEFSFGDFPKVQVYLDACRSRPAWKDTPKLPGL
jgi:glutathione S-transferase